MLAEAATCVPALTPLIAKCYGERPSPMFLPRRIRGTGVRSTVPVECTQGDAMGPALSCMALLPVLKALLSR